VVLVPLCLVLVVFALANRQLVVINFNPLVPSESLTTPGVGVPMFLVLFTVLLMGVVLGGVATWFAQSHHRRDERSYRREAERLTREVDAMRRTPSLQIDDLAKS
jgi:hypothetical protein